MTLFHMSHKTEKIVFFSVIPEIADLQPITAASKTRPDWLKKATQEYINLKNQENFGKKQLNHVVKCPGISNIVRHGWILSCWQDVVIKTNGDGSSFTWSSAVDQKMLLNGDRVGDIVSWHPKNQFFDFFGEPKNCIDSILKIQTPWRCLVPKGYYLLEQHIPYSQESRFTVFPGFFSREDGVASLNPQFKWHVMNDEILIKAGTPLAHYMLIPATQPEMQISDLTPELLQIERVARLEIDKRFVNLVGKSRSFFKDYFS